MAYELKRIKSSKSNTAYVLMEENHKWYVTAEGEMSANANVRKKIDELRTCGNDYASALWIARQLAATF